MERTWNGRRRQGSREGSRGGRSLAVEPARVAVQKLRSYGLSLADLSTRSGVAKSIISQIERNETNPTLATIWRLAHALDVSIQSMLEGGEEGPFIEHLGRGATPIFVSDDGLCRLAVTGWLKTVDWLQWYDFQADPGGVLEFGAHARGSVECMSVMDGELEVDVGGDARDRAGGRDGPLPLRPAPPHPQRRRKAGARDHGQHPESGDDRLKSGGRMPPAARTVRQSSCRCGLVRCQAVGAPIVSVVCYCEDCQEGARRIEALPDAASFCDADGGTSLIVYRDDRFACESGEELLTAYRLKEGSPTRRMVASCCNSAMFLKFEPGFWVSAYRARFEGDDLPPLDLRDQIEHRRADTPLPNDAPGYRGFPLRLFVKIISARIAMLFGR